jgi:solute carrier family 41
VGSFPNIVSANQQIYMYILTPALLCSFSDFVLVAVILITHKIKLNPDNLATPLAASIGDVVALSLLAFISSFLFEIIGKKHYKLPVTIATSILEFFFYFQIHICG